MPRNLRLSPQDALAAFPSIIYKVFGAGTLAVVFHAALILVFCITVFTLCVVCAILEECVPRRVPAQSMSSTAPPASSAPAKHLEQTIVDGVPVPSLFSIIKQRQSDKTGTLASLVQESYSSPGQVSRTKKAFDKFPSRGRKQPSPAPAVHSRPRLDTNSLDRRVALAQILANGVAALNSSQDVFAPQATSSPSSSPPRMCGRTLPPRLLNLAAGSQSGFASDPFLSRAHPTGYPVLPPVGHQVAVPPFSLPSLSQGVKIFKQGPINNQFHTVAIPMDVFKQHLAARQQSDKAPASAASSVQAPQSPASPTPVKLKAADASPRSKTTPADWPKPTPTASVADKTTRAPLAPLSGNVPLSTRGKSDQDWVVTSRTKQKRSPARPSKKGQDARHAGEPSGIKVEIKATDSSAADTGKEKRTRSSNRTRGRRGGKENKNGSATQKVAPVASV
ncbi:hypothetical protein EIP91_008789 [Steccherinum ochraceum]|uniref:Uncharacterized protein n=1 Tax=Steccherinum ochraceum TaxID=92696 RepID=A0A4R0R2D4_9APHY|nr:hypothetical protein EIP91_008789 [Steccherinum ochraceum]